MLPHYILCSTRWALRLVFHQDEKTFNAFRITIGHELTHKEGDFMHPSWERREYYAEHFNFDEELIRQIAIDVGCSNEKLIKRISEYYKKIILRS